MFRSDYLSEDLSHQVRNCGIEPIIYSDHCFVEVMVGRRSIQKSDFNFDLRKLSTRAIFKEYQCRLIFTWLHLFWSVVQGTEQAFQCCGLTWEERSIGCSMIFFSVGCFPLAWDHLYLIEWEWPTTTVPRAWLSIEYSQSTYPYDLLCIKDATFRHPFLTIYFEPFR